MGIAVRVGARITSHLASPRLSANNPIKGLARAGICMTVDKSPAWLKVKDNFSMIKGSRGDKKLVYRSWTKWAKETKETRLLLNACLPGPIESICVPIESESCLVKDIHGSISRHITLQGSN